MKKKFLFFVLLVITVSSYAQSIKVRGGTEVKELKSIQEKYCCIQGDEKMRFIYSIFVDDSTIALSDYLFVEKNGDVIDFNSFISLANFMYKNGWTLKFIEGNRYIFEKKDLKP